MNTNDIQKFGYAELYELEDSLDKKYGRFVGFSYKSPEKVCYSNDIDNIIGITSANFSCISNNYSEWPQKYVYDMYGKPLYQNKTIAGGKKEYDDQLEIPYIKTYEINKLEQIVNQNYDCDMYYTPRLDRDEWVPVVIIGQCIVEDDGTCIVGHKCSLYEGDDPKLKGTVTLTFNPNQYGWHVLKRISKNTVLIFLK